MRGGGGIGKICKRTALGQVVGCGRFSGACVACRPMRLVTGLSKHRQSGIKSLERQSSVSRAPASL